MINPSGFALWKNQRQRHFTFESSLVQSRTGKVSYRTYAARYLIKLLTVLALRNGTVFIKVDSHPYMIPRHVTDGRTTTSG